MHVQGPFGVWCWPHLPPGVPPKLSVTGTGTNGMHIGLSVLFLRAWLCWVEATALRVCMGATGSSGGAYIISSPRVPGHAHFHFF